MEKKSKRSPALIKAQEIYKRRLKKSGLGKKSVTVWFSPEEREQLDRARGDESRNSYIRRHLPPIRVS